MSEAAMQDEGEHELGFDAPADAVVSIETGGDPIRSLLRTIRPVAEEVKLRFDSDGLSVKSVDPANVALVDVDVPAEAWDHYECAESVVVGMPLDRLAGALSFARKRAGDGDPVRLDLTGAAPRYRCRVAVVRQDEQVRRVSEFYALDPDNVREEPDIPTLELSHQADVALDTFREAAESIEYDYGWLTRDGHTLLFGTQPTRQPDLDEDDEMVEVFEFPESAWGDSDGGDGSLFSLDYLTDLLGGLDAGKADHFSIEFGEEFPAYFRGEWTDWGFSVTMMLAPRMESDSQ